MPMIHALKNYRCSESGNSTIEYAMIAGGISLSALTVTDAINSLVADPINQYQSAITIHVDDADPSTEDEIVERVLGIVGLDSPVTG